MKADKPKLTGTTDFEYTGEKPVLEIKKTLLTSKEMEDIFRVSRTTIWRHAKNGIFKKIKIGQKVYFEIEQVKRVIKQ